MTIREQLNAIVKDRILIMDGAMGSMIQALNLTEDDFRGSAFADHPTPLKGCNDLLCLTKPEAISAIHEAYLEAGADIIETCSFNSTAVSLSDYGLGDKAYEISVAAADIARAAADKFSTADKPRFVAGSMGPTSKGASLYPDINDPSKRSIRWDELEAAYYDNARGLLDGGADILLIETIFDTVNAKAALFAISRIKDERGIDIPIMVSASVSGESGRLLAGQTLEAFCISVMNAKPWSIGLNCSMGAEKLRKSVRTVSEYTDCLVSACPNAGLPNESGQYEETPESMAKHMGKYMAEEIVNIVGGCCGTTPAHIAAIAEKAKNFEPRIPPKLEDWVYLSGLEPLPITHVGSAIAIAMHATVNDPELFDLIKQGEYESAADTMRDIIENEDYPILIHVDTDDEKTIDGYLDFALMDPHVAKLPFIIRSSRWIVLETALKRFQGRCMVSLKDEKEGSRKARLIHQLGGVPVTGIKNDFTN